MHVDARAQAEARQYLGDALKRGRDGLGDVVTQTAARVLGRDVGLDRVLAEGPRK